MPKRKIFTIETRKELIGWGVSAALLTFEYVLYTQFQELSPTGVFLMAATKYVPPPILRTMLLFMLFLVIVSTGFAFVWFTQRLVVKFCKWIMQKKK